MFIQILKKIKKLKYSQLKIVNKLNSSFCRIRTFWLYPLITQLFQPIIAIQIFVVNNIVIVYLFLLSLLLIVINVHKNK